jgi:hypothetical protein
LQAVTDHVLRRAIHGRRVDEAPAGLEEVAHHLGALVTQAAVVADIEGDPAAQADHGNLFA